MIIKLRKSINLIRRTLQLLVEKNLQQLRTLCAK